MLTYVRVYINIKKNKKSFYFYYSYLIELLLRMVFSMAAGSGNILPLFQHHV